jgi:CheY-like chemotaxis protein
LVTTAVDGNDAPAKVPANPPDVLVLDLTMRGLT